MVGGISTLIEIGIFNLLVYQVGWHVVWAKVVASLIALVNAYVGNREWTFGHRDRRGRANELVLFLLANGVCTVLGVALVWLGVEAAQVVLAREPGVVVVNLVNLVSIAVVVLVRFVFYHRVVFRAPRRPAAPAQPADDGSPSERP